jgi:hypothetical protein
LQVDDELVSDRWEHWKISRLFALENAPHINAGLTYLVGNARSVAHQPAGIGKNARVIGGGHGAARRQHHDLHATVAEERGTIDQQCVGEPTFDFQVEIVPPTASGCQWEKAETSVGRRFLGSSQSR